VKKICLMDMDGTLTLPRKSMKKNTLKSLLELKDKFKFGIVSGSDFDYIKEQCSDFLKNEVFDLQIFPCNGTKKYIKKNGIWVCDFSVDMKKEIGESNFRKLMFCLLNLQSSLYKNAYSEEIPLNGTFIQYRGSMINWCIPGRGSKDKGREEFKTLDKKYNLRKLMIEKLKSNDFNYLNFALGGSTSIDIYPKGWDKTFCLRHFSEKENIYFIGDKCSFGGNDFHIFEELKPNSFEVKNPQETIRILNKI